MELVVWLLMLLDPPLNSPANCAFFFFFFCANFNAQIGTYEPLFRQQSFSLLTRHTFMKEEMSAEYPSGCSTWGLQRETGIAPRKCWKIDQALR